MAEQQPEPISTTERKARLKRAKQIAKRLGFVGRVEYRHVNSTAGGAQYGIGTDIAEDLLLVFADAFERDADPEDFSLEAIVAHERGHQLLCRHERLERFTAGRSTITEEILASLLGSLISEEVDDAEALLLKAVAEMMDNGVKPKDAVRLAGELRSYLEKML